jgi:hypothetical protein
MGVGVPAAATTMQSGVTVASRLDRMVLSGSPATYDRATMPIIS